MSTKNRESKDNKLVYIGASKLMSLGRITSELRHEINNMLSIITAYAQKVSLLTKRDGVDSEEYRKAVKKIDTNARKISKYLSDSRSYAKATISTDIEGFTLEQIYDQIELLYGRILEKSKIELKADKNQLKTTFQGNFHGTLEVITHFVHNAVAALRQSNTNDDHWIQLETDGQHITVSENSQRESIELVSNQIDPGIPFTKMIAESIGAEIESNQDNSITSFRIKLPKAS